MVPSFWSHKILWKVWWETRIHSEPCMEGRGSGAHRTRWPTCWCHVAVCSGAHFPLWELCEFPSSSSLVRGPNRLLRNLTFFLFLLHKCSKSCQGGFRVREVRCLSDDMTPSSLCDPQLKPEERESCNTQDCVPEVGEFGVPI
jgi:hypothetical protein